MYHAPLSVLAHFTAAVHQTVIERRKRNSRPVAQKKKKKKKRPDKGVRAVWSGF